MRSKNSKSFLRILAVLVILFATFYPFIFSRQITVFLPNFETCTTRRNNNDKRISESSKRYNDYIAASPTNLIKAAQDAAILLNNSSQYKWTGNHFIPPYGVPTFTPANYRNYFAKRNTLFIGDSTGRRAYATLFAMMTSCNGDDDNIKVKDLDGFLVIDFNKAIKRSRKEVCNNPSRNFYDRNLSFVCREILDATSWPLCPKKETQRNETLLDFNSTEENKKKVIRDDLSRFDLIWINCLAGVHDFFAQHGDFMNDYDLIIVSTGIWESLRSRDCKMNLQHFNKEQNLTSTFTTSLEMKIDILLDIIAETSSPNLQIVLRSPGFDFKRPNDQVMLTIGDRMRNFIRNLISPNPFSSSSYEILQNKTKEVHPLRALKPYSNHNSSSWQKKSTKTNFNLTFVDWQTVISKRSFGEDRIKGDINPHYGLEARLLFAQQLLHHLRRLELKHEHSVFKM